MRLAGARVLVTGGDGFLGRALLARLQAAGAAVVAPTRHEYDLLREADVARMFADHRPQLVFHLAAEVGGIAYNVANPGRTFYANAVMSALVLEQARL
ncbi:MAG TPA: NAD-dependent epimerase/dehydratase family protein, partial [Methylomirabilota bacterium]|nr:NAD-dependent epimerase/dehydratase family protein [Methylomirabilota bacterium]